MPADRINTNEHMSPTVTPGQKCYTAISVATRVKTILSMTGEVCIQS